MNKYINSLQSYILPSLTGRSSLLESVALHWGRVCFFLLSLLLFAACSSDNDEQVQQPQPEKSYPLTIEVTENPMTGDGENSSNRAAIINNSSLSGFNMYYVYGSDPITSGARTATKDEDGKWTGSADWPDGTAMIDWYAYTDGTFQLNGGNPYINFTVVEDVSNQKDLLVATTTASFTDNGGKLTFNFDHACAALRFWFKKSTNMSGYKLDIKEVVLCNVAKQAKYYYASGWDDPYSDRSVYSLYSSSSNYTLGSESYIAADGGTPSYLFLIPQTLTAWDTSTAIASATTQTYLKIKCTVTKTSTSTVIHNDTYAYIPFAATLEAGKQYDVKINIGKNSLYSGPGIKIIPAS